MKLTILIFLIASVANAENLQDSIDKALKKSREYKIQQHYLNINKSSKKEAITAFAPSAELNYQFGRKQDIRGDNDTTVGFENEEGVRVSVSQPIFRGFQGVFNLQKEGAKYYAQNAKLEFFKRELSYRVINLYLNIYKFQQITALLAQNYSLYQEIAKQERSKGSLITENQKIDSIINMQNAHNELENNKNELELKKLEYQDLVGDIEGEFQAINISNNNIKSLELEKILREIKSSPSILEKKYEYLASKFSYKASVGNLLPEVKIVASKNNQTNVVYLNGQDLETESIVIDVTIPILRQGSAYYGQKKERSNMEIKKEEFALKKEEITIQGKTVFCRISFFKKKSF